MTLARFLTICYYQGGKPSNVSESRWNGMMLWLETRNKEGFSLLALYDIHVLKAM